MSSTQSSAEIERQVEGTRAELAHSLDTLRDRVSPEHLMDQAVGYVRNAGGDDIKKSLALAVREHPLPVLLIGAGIGVMLLAGEKKSKVSSSGSTGSHARDLVGHATDTARGKASGVVAQAGEMASHAYEAASGAAGAAAAQVATGAGAVSDTAASLAHDAQHRATRFGSSIGASLGTATGAIERVLHEQPLALAAAGVAVGAALGLLIPGTRSENRLLGAQNEALQEKVKSIAHDGLEQVQQAAGDHLEKVRTGVAGSLEHAQDRLLQEGALSPNKLGETISATVHEVRQAVQDTAHDAVGQVREAVGGEQKAEPLPA